MLLKCLRMLESRRNARLSTQQVFSDIYREQKWGSSDRPFCSGSGTASSQIVDLYVEAVTRLVAEQQLATCTAVDLGCGDFAVGSRLAPLFAHYVGVDIVPELVNYLANEYGHASLRFVHANLVEDELPDGDVAFLRQVLQHLSNVQISAILAKLTKYRYVIITEHQPTDSRLREKNRDKVHGGGIRLFEGSGVFLDAPPFNLPADQLATLLEVPGHGFGVDTDPGIIRTYVWQPRHA